MLERLVILCFILLSISMSSCTGGSNKNAGKELIIFHAGSLSVPIDEVIDSFHTVHPGYTIKTEVAGSVECARKITELNKPCDVILTSDYAVIRDMLIPEHASWYVKFASNEMSIAYTDRSRFANVICQDNWPRILLNDSVAYGRADPNLDPCGYRTVLTLQLAEDYYRIENLADHLLKKDQRYLRPKEVDLLALLGAHAIDYIFIYRSVARQHGLNYLLLPDEINLENPEMDSLYATATTHITGKDPEEMREVRGEAMIYGLSIPTNAPHPGAAIKFTEFLLSADKGMKIMERNGQPSVVPATTEYYDALPASVKTFAKDPAIHDGTVEAITEITLYNEEIL